MKSSVENGSYRFYMANLTNTPEIHIEKWTCLLSLPARGAWIEIDKGCNGNAAEHYSTMTVDEICKLPVNVAGGGYCF